MSFLESRQISSELKLTSELFRKLLSFKTTLNLNEVSEVFGRSQNSFETVSNLKWVSRGF